VRHCCFEGDDARVELAALLCLLDGVLGELFVADGDRDPHQLGIVSYLEGEQGEQLQTIVMTAGAEPVVCLVSFAQRHRVQRQIREVLSRGRVGSGERPGPVPAGWLAMWG
jgi:hypothetical protein